MSAKLRRAGLLLFGVVGIGVVVWNLTPTPSQSDETPPSNFATPFASTTAAFGEAPSAPLAAETRDYAISLDELQGFPPDLQPGSQIELWVGWDRPSGAAPKLQRLIPRAELVRVVPPVTPGGPTAVVVRVPIGRIPDLLWADGFGSLSVTVAS
jgi:hypothetical protein